MPVEKRITVNLTRRGAQAADALTERNAETLTDTINRALVLLEYVDARIAAGDALAIITPGGESTRLVML